MDFFLDISMYKNHTTTFPILAKPRSHGLSMRQNIPQNHSSLSAIGNWAPVKDLRKKAGHDGCLQRALVIDHWSCWLFGVWGEPCSVIPIDSPVCLHRCRVNTYELKHQLGKVLWFLYKLSSSYSVSDWSHKRFHLNWKTYSYHLSLIKKFQDLRTSRLLNLKSIR